MDTVLYYPDDGMGGWAQALADAVLAPVGGNGNGRGLATGDGFDRQVITVNQWRERNGLDPDCPRPWVPLQRAGMGHDMEMSGEVDEDVAEDDEDLDDEVAALDTDDGGFDGEVVDSFGAGPTLDLLLLDDDTVLLSEDGDTAPLPALDLDEAETLVDTLRELRDDGDPVEDREVVLDWLTATYDEDGTLYLRADVDGDDTDEAEISIDADEVDAVIDAFDALLDRVHLGEE